MNRNSSSRSFSSNPLVQDRMTYQGGQPQPIQKKSQIKIKEETDQKVIDNYFSQNKNQFMPQDRPRLNTIDQGYQPIQKIVLPLTQRPQFPQNPNPPFNTKNSVPQSIRSKETIKILSVQDTEDPEKFELKKKVEQLQKQLKESETQISSFKKDVEQKEKENTMKQEKIKQYDTDIKQLKKEIDDYKKQLKEKSDIIDKMKNEMQSREKKLNDQLLAAQQECNIQKQKFESELITASQRLNDLDILKSENQRKQTIILDSQSQIDKLRNNIEQLVCKTQQSSDIVQTQGNLQWKVISKRILKTPFKCSLCNTNNNVNDYLEKIIKDTQERLTIENIEKIKINLLLNSQVQVKLCSTANCNFFCIWQPNLVNLYGNQGYCMLCQKNTIFIVQS